MAGAGTRAAKSGVAKDFHDKLMSKYSKDDETACRQWIEAVLERKLSNQTVGAEQFQECLRDGVVLCDLINALQPGAIKKVNKGKMPFVQMENISQFLTAAKNYGVKVENLFQTVDLYDGMNIGAVVSCIYALGGCATKKNFRISFGVAESDPNKRNFSEEQMQAGKSIIGLQAGTNQGASQAGMSAFGNTRKL